MHCCESCMKGREVNLPKNLCGLHPFFFFFNDASFLPYCPFLFALGLDSLWIIWTVGVMIPRVLLIMRIKKTWMHLL